MRADMSSQRNILIVGFAFLMALGLPNWVESNKEVFIHEGHSQLCVVCGSIIWALLKSPMAVAALVAGICDSLISGTPEERGIAPKMDKEPEDNKVHFEKVAQTSVNEVKDSKRGLYIKQTQIGGSNQVQIGVQVNRNY